MSMGRMEIPCGSVTPEQFVSIRAQLRVFLSAPAEVIPDTHRELCDALGGGEWNYKLYPWLHTHGYEVVQDADKLGYLYFVIRPGRSSSFNFEAVSAKMSTAIDEQVIKTLLGEDIP